MIFFESLLVSKTIAKYEYCYEYCEICFICYLFFYFVTLLKICDKLNRELSLTIPKKGKYRLIRINFDGSILLLGTS